MLSGEKLSAENRALTQQVARQQSDDALLGDSAPMRAVFDQIKRVGPTYASVLLIGESGSGKELVARAIHQHSRRAAQPFVAINCGAIASTLIEAEMFGHEKGSFTGAIRSHAGVFERAHGGTLFLDEVTEMPCDLQVRLLRVLETGRFFRVGGTDEIAINVRVIAATNRCPLAAVREGKLREDVLYRLAVFPIELPPLRERDRDIELLADHFLANLNSQAGTSKRFSAESLLTLRRHLWPGNVRELSNAIERAFILADETVQIVPLAPTMPYPVYLDEAPGGLGIAVGSRLEQAERSLIEATLEHYEGNKRQTAEVLGCSLKTLYNKLHEYNRRPIFTQN